MNRFNRPLILASSSPRRQYLMKEIGFQFKIQAPDIDESFPSEMDVTLVPGFLAESKARVFAHTINSEVVVASDTVVILDEKILNKPIDRSDAISMLNELAGRTHLVVTAVCIYSKEKMEVFDDHAHVTFKKISKKEIEFYVDTCKPFDKAGAYGAQDCLLKGINPCSPQEIEFLKSINRQDLIDKSLTSSNAQLGIEIIEKIQGSYFTVMGLPIHKIYPRLMNYQE